VIDSITPLPSPLPEIAGRVNGVPILTAQVAVLAEGDPPRGLLPADRPGAYRSALNQFVIRELLFQEAKSRNVQVSDADVEAGVAEARKTFPSFPDALKARGLDEAGFREDVRKSKSIGRLVGDVGASVPNATDAEVKAYFEANPTAFRRDERVRARHLLIGVAPGATPEQKEVARKRCQELLARIKGGADFAELARQFSQDPGSAKNGGDLGEFGRNMMVKPFEDAAFALKAGELSGVVESEFGFHVLKVEARLPASEQSLAEATPAIRSKLRSMRANVQLQKLVNELRARAKIETLL
jgi:peptidyl-prolyl cis-trans isomerase C